ncbi:uncharacterized protein G2W53_043563 [Senna tora]|uniref:Uncharacterized protein n=1 Tax=Senna tora TaxID=362788 RepID=A0A834SP54_9FABA|nr:uncharacterized protein G2W53_043563 [Senna tora]
MDGEEGIPASNKAPHMEDNQNKQESWIFYS